MFNKNELNAIILPYQLIPIFINDTIHPVNAILLWLSEIQCAEVTLRDSHETGCFLAGHNLKIGKGFF